MNNRQYTPWVAALFLIIAAVSIVSYELGTLYSSDISTRLQALSVLYLAILSLAFFYINFKKSIHNSLINVLGIILLTAAFVGFCWIEYVACTANGELYPVPLFMASLGLGLFLGGHVLTDRIKNQS